MVARGRKAIAIVAASRSDCADYDIVFSAFRLMYPTFFGKPRMSHEVEHHIHICVAEDDDYPLLAILATVPWARVTRNAAQPGA